MASVSPVYRFELEGASPSNNAIREMHYMTYRKVRREWQAQVIHALAEAGRMRAAPVTPAILVVERFSAGQLDWDNAYGGLKPLLDCLVQPSARNPDGLGLIVDDNPKAMPFPPIVRQLDAKRGAGKTVLSIYEYSPAHLPRLVSQLYGGQE